MDRGTIKGVVARPSGGAFDAAYSGEPPSGTEDQLRAGDIVVYGEQKLLSDVLEAESVAGKDSAKTSNLTSVFLRDRLLPSGRYAPPPGAYLLTSNVLPPSRQLFSADV